MQGHNASQKIYEDELVGMREGISHYETGKTAWGYIDAICTTAVEKALGYWPKESAHFEITF
jgi:hypothetical protein